MISVSVHEKAPVGWDEFLLTNEFGTFYQTSHYAEYAFKEAGLKPFFLRAEEKGETVGELLLLKGSRIHGLLANMPLSSLTTRVSRNLVPSFTWVYGPAADGVSAASVLIAKANEVSKGKVRTCSPHPLSKFDSCFIESGFKQSKWATFIIDLREGEEALFAKVDKAARKLVNRTLEQVDVVQVESEEDYEAYHGVLNENRKRNKVYPYRYTPMLWEIWRKTNTGAVFIAKDKTSGKVLAGLGISSFNGYLNEWGAGTSTYALENKIYAQDAVKWSIIKWGIEKGFKYFDLTGVNPEPKDDKEKGIFRYKEKWGGKLVEYSIFRQ